MRVARTFVWRVVLFVATLGIEIGRCSHIGAAIVGGLGGRPPDVVDAWAQRSQISAPTAAKWALWGAVAMVEVLGACGSPTDVLRLNPGVPVVDAGPTVDTGVPPLDATGDAAPIERDASLPRDGSLLNDPAPCASPVGQVRAMSTDTRSRGPVICSGQ